MSFTKTITHKKHAVVSDPAHQLSEKGSPPLSEPAAGYRRPQHGVFPYLPAAWVPYAELMRLDRLSGFWAFYWHYLIGLGYALNLPSSAAPPSLLTIAGLVSYLYLWTTVFRGITCTWNDTLDQNFDRQVARTRLRPIARGAVSTAQGHFFTLAQMVVGGLLLAPLPPAAAAYAVVDGVLLFVYPLLKRCTDFPQVELGFGLSYPIIMVCAMLDQDPLAPLWAGAQTDLAGTLATLAGSHAIRSTACLYAAGILWTVIFDTVYAHQDYEDDLRAGVMGLAVRLGRKGTKPVLGVLAAAQVACLVAAGTYAGFGVVYSVLSCGGAAASLATMLWCVQLEIGESCAWWFGPGSRSVAATVVAGLLGQFVVKVGW